MKSWKPIFVFALIDVKRLFRDKLAIFFTIVFPIIFLLVFGSLYGRNSTVSFNVALINQSNTQLAEATADAIGEQAILKIKQDIDTVEKADEQLRKSELDAMIIVPKEFGQVASGETIPSGELKVVYSENSSSAAQAIESLLNQLAGNINSQLVPVQSPVTVTLESTNTRSLTAFDYIFSGLLGFALLTLGIFGPTSVYPRLKQKGVLRRYKTTPLRVWQYFSANILSNGVYGLLSVAAMVAVAYVLFDLRVQGSYLSLAVLVVFSAAMLFGIGLAIGGWAKNESQAAPLANLIAFPMMFLSGSFFPRFLMPEWLQQIAVYLPLSPVIDGARLIITEGKSIFEIGFQLGLIALWTVVIYAIAIRTFRWE